MQGTTQSGFDFTLDDEVLDDYELLEILVELDKGDYSHITDMVNMLLGEKQKKALKEHIRAKDGKVSAKTMMLEVTEIFKASQTGKK